MTWLARDLAYRYRGASTRAVDCIALDVRAGELVAILGPNGAGKSTLLHLLVGTIVPAAGAIDFEGMPLPRWRRRALARRIGVVPQSEDATFPLTTRQLVAMGRYPHLGAWEPEGDGDRAAIAWAMDRCGLAGFDDRPIRSLSGGERQRARIARALAQRPAAFALDEPTASLDVHHEMALFGLFRELANEGSTVLLTTHNLNLAARFADRIVLLDGGRVIAHGRPAEVITEPTVAATWRWPARVVAHPGPGPDTGAPQVVPLAPPIHSRTNA